jgi:hypothetical protein
MLRRIAALVVAVAAVLTPMVVAAAPAQAHHNWNGCNGTRLEHLPIRQDSGTRILGYLDLYYGGGWNCAFTRLHPDFAGTRSQLDVMIWACSSTNPNSCNVAFDRDQGFFRYYAGPATVWAPDLCVLVQGSIALGLTGPVFGNVAAGPFHCD